MVLNDPIAELDPQFSTDNATSTAWVEARDILEKADIFWLSTVRPDGRPHVTPLIAVWLDGAFYFCTGESERKAKNLAQNPHCVVTTGCNSLSSGLDVIVEGDAVQITNEPRLQQVADVYLAKYGQAWHFTVRDGVFHGESTNIAIAQVYEITPITAFGFRRGESFSQTRWRF